MIFTSNVSLSLEKILNQKNYSKVIVLVDENTQEYCLPLLETDLYDSTIVFKGNEERKNLEGYSFVIDSLNEVDADRKSCLVILGGGMLLDLGAFAAATYKRGISFISIPTTLLAMTDASIGGKCGINFNHHKNQIGLFTESDEILIDTAFLNSLPDKEIRSGYAEIIKHAIISDAELWSLIETDINKMEWQEIVEKSAKIKLKIVEEDFKESGLRKILNYGHTVGHILESYGFENSERKRLHGEAIAEGMVIEAFLAYQKFKLSESDLKQICEKISLIYQLESVDDNLSAYLEKNIQADKKNDFGRLLFSLPTKIGHAEFDISINKEEIKAALYEYNGFVTGEN